MPWVIHKELDLVKGQDLNDGDIWYLPGHPTVLVLQGPGFHWTHVRYQAPALVPTTFGHRNLSSGYREREVRRVLVRWEP